MKLQQDWQGKLLLLTSLALLQPGFGATDAAACEMSSAPRSAVVVGATGATGRQVVKALLASDRWAEVFAVVRAPRPELFADGTPKLRVQVVPDLPARRLPVWRSPLVGS